MSEKVIHDQGWRKTTFSQKKMIDKFFFWMGRGAKLTNQRPVLQPSAHAKNHIFADKNQTITFSRYFLLFAKRRG